LQVTAPQQSTKPFVAPTGIPIKKTPPISDIVEEKFLNEKIPPTLIENDIVDDHLNLKKNEINSSEIIKTEVELEIKKIEKSTPVSPDLGSIDKAHFAQIWAEMFEEIFVEVPTIYYPLKGITPEIKENIIEVRLKNELQKEYFEPKIRDILAYLRSNVSNLFEDIKIQVDETLVTRKVIYDTVDKMKNLAEQNPNFEQFNSILDLRVKE
jgi:hypothetical protein